MKYLADVLTTLRIVMAAVTCWAGLTHLWSLAMTVFIVGILSDAIDGPIARRWPYSAEENQKFFWRRNDPHMWDNTADLLLTTGGLVAVTFGLLNFWPAVLICLGVPVVAGCFIGSLEFAARHHKPKLAEMIDVLHGWVFAAELFAMLIVMTLQATSAWRSWLVAYGIVAVGILVFKWDRATSRKEVDYSRS